MASCIYGTSQVLQPFLDLSMVHSQIISSGVQISNMVYVSTCTYRSSTFFHNEAHERSSVAGISDDDISNIVYLFISY